MATFSENGDRTMFGTSGETRIYDLYILAVLIELDVLRVLGQVVQSEVEMYHIVCASEIEPVARCRRVGAVKTLDSVRSLTTSFPSTVMPGVDVCIGQDGFGI